MGGNLVAGQIAHAVAFLLGVQDGGEQLDPRLGTLSQQADAGPHDIIEVAVATRRDLFGHELLQFRGEDHTIDG